MSYRAVRVSTYALGLLCAALSPTLKAQQSQSMPGMDMPAQGQRPATNMPAMQGMGNMPDMQMPGPTGKLADNVLRHSTSGTSLEPDSTAPAMLMQMREPGQFAQGWMLMLHGQASIAEQQQTSARGHDKLFADNWVMPMAMRRLGPGQLTLRAMLSLEPATISGRYYPELFQQGETAFGKPIIDGQHPHNLFMELGALYDLKISDQSLLSIYAAPVGDPALGPVAYPHRASAQEDPLAPLGHHLEDSTHIAYEVLTGGITVYRLHLEASGFHGREPGENRWIIAVGGLDSWSTRLSFAATRDIAAQYSIGHLHSPEAQHPEEGVLRQTASFDYHHRWQAASLDALALWGRNHTIASAENANGYLLEATHAPWPGRQQFVLDENRKCRPHHRSAGPVRSTGRVGRRPACRPTPPATLIISTAPPGDHPSWERNIPSTTRRLDCSTFTAVIRRE